MGLLDDAASAISGRSSYSKQHKRHSSSRYSDSKHKHRSRSRSSSRSRYHANRSSSHLPGIAASLFGVDESRQDKSYKTSSRSFFGLGSSHGNASRGSFFGFGLSLLSSRPATLTLEKKSPQNQIHFRSHLPNSN